MALTRFGFIVTGDDRDGLAPGLELAALATMASNTGWTSFGELEMTRRISLVAACCPSAAARRCAKSRAGEARRVADLRRRLGAAATLAFLDFGFRRISLSCAGYRRLGSGRGSNDS